MRIIKLALHGLFSLLLVCSMDTTLASPKAFDELAKDLLRNIDRSTGKAKDLRIAIVPFKQDDIPIRLSIAESYNDSLLEALLQRNRRGHRFLARNELEQVIEDIEATGRIYEDEDLINELMSGAGAANILITGRITRSSGGIKLNYKVVDTAGAILGTTQEELAITDDATDLDQTTLTLDSGLKAAAQHFYNNLSDMEEVQEGGVRYQSTGTQPAAGLYIQDKLIGYLSNLYTNVLTDRKLKVRKPTVSKSKIGRVRGISMSAKQIKSIASVDDPASFTLSGSYWDFGDQVELRFSLTNASGVSVAWNERVRKDTFPTGIAFTPKENLEELRENDGLGPNQIRLSTSHGKDPLYRIGESLDMIIQAERDSWLYCFYRQANGEMLQIFPNPFYLNDYSEPFIQSNRVYVIPGDDIFPFEITVSEPTGTELLKCFTADRNITNQLPQALRGNSLDPIPEALSRELSKTFRNVMGASVSENSLVITVAE